MKTIFTITSTKDNCWMSHTHVEEDFEDACSRFNHEAWWLQTSNTPSNEKMAHELLRNDFVLETFKNDMDTKHSLTMRMHQVE